MSVQYAKELKCLFVGHDWGDNKKITPRKIFNEHERRLMTISIVAMGGSLHCKRCGMSRLNYLKELRE